MNYWLVKSEPHKYPISQFEEDGSTIWDGVRNYQARNNLQAMRLGDLCLYYHSNEGREIVGLARVVKEAFQDPTTSEDAWVVVELAFEEFFPRPLGLAEMKAHPVLSKMELIRQSRLSVVPVSIEEFDLVIRLTHPE
jgi:predicted RNA-binding protein with PUA-like domain